MWRLDATAQAELVRAREVSGVELVQAAIARIGLLNARVNAVVTPLYESALAAAGDVRRTPATRRLRACRCW